MFVKEDCRNNGIAGELMKKSCMALGTDTPLVTVSDRNLPQLQRFLDKYNFKFSYKKKGVYKQKDTEIYFNNEATEILKKDILTPLFFRIKNDSQRK